MSAEEPDVIKPYEERSFVVDASAVILKFGPSGFDISDGIEESDEVDEYEDIPKGSVSVGRDDEESELKLVLKVPTKFTITGGESGVGWVSWRPHIQEEIQNYEDDKGAAPAAASDPLKFINPDESAEIPSQMQRAQFNAIDIPPHTRSPYHYKKKILKNLVYFINVNFFVRLMVVRLLKRLIWGITLHLEKVIVSHKNPR
ncbi:hypothetical protein NE237_000269 [Protea cynaroides]|uniref:Uncharacterized protein n=1 Tax=Protea cynaroides TaxID=273540 RepID=A0A9Q0QX13_9MAGN|nr:hypothetical protein NE237_000269 [Protea cynaroides]